MTDWLTDWDKKVQGDICCLISKCCNNPSPFVISDEVTSFKCLIRSFIPSSVLTRFTYTRHLVSTSELFGPCSLWWSEVFPPNNYKRQLDNNQVYNFFFANLSIYNSFGRTGVTKTDKFSENWLSPRPTFGEKQYCGMVAKRWRFNTEKFAI